MTVNANVRCIEWFDVNTITPTNCQFVLGWYPQHYGGMCAVVRLNGDVWQFESGGPGAPSNATPSHWCEFPDGPDTLAVCAACGPTETPCEHYPTSQDFL